MSEEDTGSTAEQDIPACLLLQKTQKFGFDLDVIRDFPACVALSRGPEGLQMTSQGRTELIRFVFSGT